MTTRAPRAALALLVFTTACSFAAPTPADSPRASVPAAQPITVGSGPTVELQLMSELYAQVLEASGHEVTRQPPSADATSLLASVRNGDVDLAAVVLTELVPVTGADRDVADLEVLRASLGEEGLRLLAPSGAEHSIGVAMLREDADQAGVATVSELVAVAGDVAWGLPSDCPAQPHCSALLSAYGLALDELVLTTVPMCAVESATALNDDTVDASLMCTTQPEIERLNLVVLEDDLEALPAGTIAPLVRAEWLDPAPVQFATTIDMISAQIDTDALTSLGVQVALEDRAVSDVAREWLEDNGLN